MIYPPQTSTDVRITAHYITSDVTQSEKYCDVIIIGPMIWVCAVFPLFSLVYFLRNSFVLTHLISRRGKADECLR